MKFKIGLFFLASFLFFASPVLAQEKNYNITAEEIFKARVIEITQQEERAREDGSKFIQQNLRLQGLEGLWKGKEFNFNGVSDLEVFKSNIYAPGDKVLVNYIKDAGGEEDFLVVDYVRSGYLYLLLFILIAVMVAIGRGKGIKAIISLFFSFVVILYYIIPAILKGGDPLLAALIGSFVLLMVMIYLTEGLNRKSHLAVVSIFISLLVTFFLSLIFTNLTKLTGTAQEDVMFLMGAGGSPINFKGLLLAGILIGALGVLDDLIIAQIEAVEQIKKANPSLNKRQVFKAAFAIGNTHLGAAINTLFLTYAGASLPLLLLFKIQKFPFVGFNQIINNESIATEIVRTLVGSVGVALSLPIATFLAVSFYKNSIIKETSR